MKKLFFLMAFSLVFSWGYSEKKVAFLGMDNSINEIADDDEKAAAEWFVNNCLEGEFISVARVAEGTVDLSGYELIWIAVDRVGITTDGMLQLINTIKEELTDYYKNGGNLLLTTHATALIAHLGRTTRMPNFYLSHEGDGVLSDVWSMNLNIGVAGGSYDHTSHPIFKNLTDTLIFDHPTIPLIGPGFREAHFTMWFLDQFGYEGNPVDEFQTENDAIVLATWGQPFNPGEFTTAGIVEFLPTGNYLGRSIAIGLGTYEWNQNTNENQYQRQIELLTENIIEYLTSSGSGEAGVYNFSNKDIDIITNKDRIFILGDKTGKISIYTYNGMLASSDNITQSTKEFDISFLPHGIYLISINDDNGKLILSRKMIKN